MTEQTEHAEQGARQAVGRRLRLLFEQSPDEQALQFAQPAGDEWWTWGRVAEVHTALRSVMADVDVPTSAAVAIVMRQRPVLVAAELSVLSDGRTALLVSPLQGDRALADDVSALAPAVLVAHPADWQRAGFEDAVSTSGALGIELRDDGSAVERVSPAGFTAGPVLDAAVTVLTSGTTGPAKRLPVPWTTFVDLGGGPEGRPPVSGRGALILSLPLVTLGGLLSMSRLVFGGRPMAMMERFDVHAWARLVKEHQPKVMGAPPPVVKMILDADISADHFEGVTAYMTSSAAVPVEVAAEFERRYGIPVLVGYGATEFLNSVSGWTPALWERFGAAKLGSAGRPHPGVKVRVVDAETLDRDEPEEVPVGEEGILEVDPPQRAGHLPPGWLRTSDRARVDEDGFLWILGRADDVIVRGGFKVDLGLVEGALRAHPAVTDACVVGLPDERLGQVPGAVVSLVDPGPEAREVLLAELDAWLRERVPAYAVPAVLRVADAIPQTSTLKAHRAAVRQLLSET